MYISVSLGFMVYNNHPCLQAPPSLKVNLWLPYIIYNINTMCDNDMYLRW